MARLLRTLQKWRKTDDKPRVISSVLFGFPVTRIKYLISATNWKIGLFWLTASDLVHDQVAPRKNCGRSLTHHLRSRVKKSRRRAHRGFSRSHPMTQAHTHKIFFMNSLGLFSQNENLINKINNHKKYRVSTYVIYFSTTQLICFE